MVDRETVIYCAFLGGQGWPALFNGLKPLKMMERPEILAPP